ncbi:MAG: hypothetical protein A2V67_12255 [Deltaproteobacteria bacterium RBG_13_61_14]|nr:MAG: hypothetical protein A2V67_12255 [Deltaproteobacteria bacterium RBG_13_61_14]
MTREFHLALVFSFLILGRSGPFFAAENPSSKLKVVVSILPQKYFVERIGGPDVDMEVLVGPGQSPHSYEPTPKQVARLAEAQVYFRIGVPFEDALLAKISDAFKELKVVDTRSGIQLLPMTAPDQDANLPRGAPDPHIWLDPKLVKIQAGTIAVTLSQLDPAHAAEYEKNLQAFAADLDRVNAEIAATLAPLKGQSFMVYHPAFGYFGAAYGLKQVAVESEGKEPSAKELADLIDLAKQEQVKVIFIEPQFSRKSAEAVAAAVGATVVAMDPLAPDYLHNLEAMAGQIRQALTEGQFHRSQ